MIDVGKYTQFDTLAVRLVSRFSSCVIVCIYKPGSQARTSAFFDELSDLLDYLSVLDVKFVLCGDFNCLGVITGPSPDDGLMDIVTRYNLIQHVMHLHIGTATCSTSF